MENTQIFLEYMIPHMIDALHKEGGLIDHIIDEVTASKNIEDRKSIKDKICTASNPYVNNILLRKNVEDPKKKRPYNRKNKPAPVAPHEPAPEPILEPDASPKPVPEPVKAPEPVLEPDASPKPVPEPVKAPEPVLDPVASPKPVPEPVLEPIASPTPVLVPVASPEPVPEEPKKKEIAQDGLIPMSLNIERRMKAPDKKRKNNDEEVAQEIPKGKELLKNIRKGIANEKKPKKAEKEFENMKERINLAHLKSKSVVTQDIKGAAKLLGLDTRKKAEYLLNDIEKIMNNDFEIPDDLLNLKKHELQKYCKWICANYEESNENMIKALQGYKDKNNEAPEPEQELQKNDDMIIDEPVNYMNPPDDEEDWNDPIENDNDIDYEDYENED
jgi:hypothetical protein